nr:reverse transcriptase domain-containing protein [Tanacetum cinerariifolium]
MVRDVEEIFWTLRKVNMKLNPKKCSFRLAEGVFLGYVITPEGIKPCPDKTAAVLQLPSPQTVKESDFRWTAKAEQAFQQLKQHLSELPLLVAPYPQEELIMYLSATYGAVSAVLMTERGTTQTPIYFISRALQGSELNYSPIEKLVLSLVFVAKRLRRYFQAHPITVITDQPIKQEMTRPDAAGRLQKWSIMLGEHNITYRPRTTGRWPTDSDANGSKKYTVNVDSKLVANQVLGTYVAKEDNMIKYLEIVKGLVNGFTTFSISQVPRSKNKQADALSKIASTSFAHLSKQVLVEVLEDKSIKEKEVAAVIEEDGPTWMTKLVDYLKEGVLPEDNKEARKLRLKARRLHNEGNPRRVVRLHAGPRLVVAKAIRLGYYWPTMHQDACDMIRKCNDCQVFIKDMDKETMILMGARASRVENHNDIDACIAGMLADLTERFPTEFARSNGFITEDTQTQVVHTKSVTVDVDKVATDTGSLRASDEHVRKRPSNVVATGISDENVTFKKQCMRLADLSSVSHIDLQEPIMEWRSNVFPQQDNVHTHRGSVRRIGLPDNLLLSIAIAMPLTTITAPWPFYKWGIDIVSPFPEGPGKVKFLIVAMDYFTKWVEAKAVATITGGQVKKFVWDNIVCRFDVVNNDKELRLNLDLLEERRERAAICEARAKSKMMKYYNARVRGVTFKPGDFVYRSNDASHAVAGGKLGPK